MSRSHRLFDLMQVLRRHRGTVPGLTLARELGVSLRTIRRDIVTLQAMGADIDGEPGVGYILQPGFLLPPLSFTEEEIQALVAGAQWVSRHTDDALVHAVQNALAKIGGVLPPTCDGAWTIIRSLLVVLKEVHRLLIWRRSGERCASSER